MTEAARDTTGTDGISGDWAIDDAVVRLREWGTDSIFPLSEDEGYECTLGAGESCEMRICDPRGQVSRTHARIVRCEGKYVLRDQKSRNGVWIDGLLRKEAVLAPGLEIGIGSTVLIAESKRSIELRSFLMRLLGWGSARVAVVDHALQSVRMAVARRMALVLTGEGDLVPTAYSIHRHSRDAAQPFVVCDPRRQTTEASVRSAVNLSIGVEAFGAATGGSLCVRSHRLPSDFGVVSQMLRAPNSRVQLIVCADSPSACRVYGVKPIEIPSMATREHEIDHVITECEADAMHDLGLSEVPRLAPEDRAWIRRHGSKSVSEIEKATLRLVAVRASRNVSVAATRLGMASVSLSRWLGRRDDE